MSTQPQRPSARYQRIEANCKKIWGARKEFDIDFETDDHEYYACVVREDRGLSFGPPLILTSLCDGEDRALDELDRMLRAWARQVESGEPTSREESLEIFGGANGEYKSVLEAFLNKKDEMDIRATAKKA